MTDGSFILQCGEMKIDLNPVEIESKLSWNAPAWQRRVVLLARNLEGQYYYVDSDRNSDGIVEPRLFIGKKGVVNYHPVIEHSVDSNSMYFSSAIGNLNQEGKKAVWLGLDDKEELTILDNWENAQMIYQDLGAYLDQSLQTPCDSYTAR
jgi:hypothetical protein